MVKGETPWRVAYSYGITLDELKAANPEMGAVISIGHELVIPETDIETKTFDPNYNYYTVKPKEGYYRLEVKLGVSEEELISLNPELTEKGLIAGMILRLPKRESQEFKVEDNLLVEKVNLRDSLFSTKQIESGFDGTFRLPIFQLIRLNKQIKFYKTETCKQSHWIFMQGQISHGGLD